GAATPRRKTRGRGLPSRAVGGDQNEPRPHGGEPLGRDLADARRRAGDDAGLAFKVERLRAHCSSTVQCRPASAPRARDGYTVATGSGSLAIALRCRSPASEAIRWSSTFTA